jgi:hypothetical protein
MSAAVEERLQEIRSREPTAADAAWLLALIDRMQGRQTNGFISIGEAADRVIAKMHVIS